MKNYLVLEVAQFVVEFCYFAVYGSVIWDSFFYVADFYSQIFELLFFLYVQHLFKN